MAERPIEQLYNDIVKKINETDKMSEYLRGKHDAYNDVRLDLFNLIQQDNEVEDGNDTTNTGNN